MISILALLVASISLYFVFKKQSTRPQEAEEFREYVEQMIVEFNRVSARNIGMLEDKIEDLEHKIRLCIKMDNLLKERFEEADKIELFKGINLVELYQEEKSPPSQEPVIEEFPETVVEETHSQITEQKELENTKKTSVLKSREKKAIPLSESENLFESENSELPILSEKKKQELLLSLLKEGAKKEELLAMGFSLQEINITRFTIDTEK